MKEIYVAPVCEIVILGQDDIITTSPTFNGTAINVGNEGDWTNTPGIGDW